MLRFGEKKVTEERFCGQEKPTQIWDVNVDNIVIAKLIKPNPKHLIVYLNKAIKPLIMPKMN